MRATEHSLSGLSDGSYVVAYRGEGWDQTENIYIQRFGSDGAEQVNNSSLGTFSWSADREVSVSGLSDGGFVVIWRPADGNIYGRRYTSSGDAAGSEFIIGSGKMLYSAVTKQKNKF